VLYRWVAVARKSLHLENHYSVCLLQIKHSLKTSVSMTVHGLGLYWAPPLVE